MTKDEWLKRVQEFVGDIARDDDLRDADYVEVLQELEDQAGARRERAQRIRNAQSSAATRDPRHRA